MKTGDNNSNTRLIINGSTYDFLRAAALAQKSPQKQSGQKPITPHRSGQHHHFPLCHLLHGLLQMDIR